MQKAPDDAYAESSCWIEEQLSTTITPTYPFAKFLIQLETLNSINKQRKREQEKTMKGQKKKTMR